MLTNLRRGRSVNRPLVLDHDGSLRLDRKCERTSHCVRDAVEHCSDFLAAVDYCTDLLALRARTFDRGCTDQLAVNIDDRRVRLATTGAPNW